MLPCSVHTIRISKSRTWHLHCFSIVALSACVFTIVGLQGCERAYLWVLASELREELPKKRIKTLALEDLRKEISRWSPLSRELENDMLSAPTPAVCGFFCCLAPKTAARPQKCNDPEQTYVCLEVAGTPMFYLSRDGSLL